MSDLDRLAHLHATRRAAEAWLVDALRLRRDAEEALVHADQRVVEAEARLVAARNAELMELRVPVSA